MKPRVPNVMEAAFVRALEVKAKTDVNFLPAFTNATAMVQRTRKGESRVLITFTRQYDKLVGRQGNRLVLRNKGDKGRHRIPLSLVAEYRRTRTGGAWVTTYKVDPKS